MIEQTLKDEINHRVKAEARRRKETEALQKELDDQSHQQYMLSSSNVENLATSTVCGYEVSKF